MFKSSTTVIYIINKVRYGPESMECLCLNHLRQSFILLINVKLPMIVGILTFLSRISFMLS